MEDSLGAQEYFGGILGYRTSREREIVEARLMGESGMPFESLQAGDAYRYYGPESGDTYDVVVLDSTTETTYYNVFKDKKGRSTGMQAPLTMVVHSKPDGELIKQTAGLLVGVSPSGTAGFYQSLPPPETEFITLVLEKLPSEGSPESGLIIFDDELVNKRRREFLG